MLSKSKKILVVFGTRPEAIKMCPVIKELCRREWADVSVCVTGQHKEMLQQVLETFKIVPNYNLNVMMQRQTLFDITNRILMEIKPILIEKSPDIVLVHGDTSTTFATALACFYLQIPVGHVEAGLRTNDIYSPYPEEFNRQAVSIISKLNFAPTEIAKENLLKENKDPKSIFVTGNTAIDALKWTISPNFKHPLIEWASGSRLVLLTAHRRENLGEHMRQMFAAIHQVLNENSDVKIIYPVHMNPEIRVLAEREFSLSNRIKLIDPLDVISFHNFLSHSYLVLTDSGGVQEEAPSLGVPVLVMRDTTERPEGIKAGTLRLVGTSKDSIYANFSQLLNDEKTYNEMSRASNPYGDGFASKRIADILAEKI